MNRRTRRLIVACAAALVVGVAAAAAWTLPYLGQNRPDRPVRDLVPADAPPLVGAWRSHDGREGDEGGDLDRLGLDEQTSRTWDRGDGVTVTAWVGKYSSPSRAGLEFSLRDPERKRRSFTGALDDFQEITVQRPPRPDRADAAKYFCGTRAPGGGCAVRWAWLRYGQYIVLIRTEGAPVPSDSLPPWLFDTVRQVDIAVTNAVPH